MCRKKQIFLLGIFLFAGLWTKVNSQPILVEGFAGIDNYKYQHMFMLNFSKSRVGYLNSSSVQVFYDAKQRTESMSQSYITYKLSPGVLASVGSFYATGAGFRPSVALQITQKKNDFFYLFFPRFDYLKQPSVELMTLVEYRPRLIYQVHLYSRLHLMSNYGPHHNRSFQHIVIGLGLKNTQVGFGLGFDEWGKKFDMRRNWGLLIRQELF